MPNNLTGDFEAVFQVSVRHVNGMLATLHQNGIHEDVVLKLIHRTELRIGDRRPGPGDVAEFGDWVRHLAMAGGSGGLDHIRGELTGAAPPGAAKRMELEFAQLGPIAQPPPPPGTVRGTARAQLAAATISLPADSASEVVVHTDIRAHYHPDAGTIDLPKPVHGEVQVTFEIRQAGHRLLIQPSTQDAKIRFIAAAGSGLGLPDEERISVQVRKAVRGNISVLPVDLPSGFPFSAFKGLGSGSGQALALPLNLSSANPPVGNIQSVSHLFIGPSAFAFAVSQEFVKKVFQPTIDTLRQFQRDFSISIPILPDPTYHFSVTDAQLQFHSGSIDLVIKGKATTGYPLAPDYNNIVIRQRFTLGMLFGTLFLPALDEELTVSGLPGAAIDRVKLGVIAVRNQQLPAARNALNAQLNDARNRLTTALRSFDPSASVKFRAGTSEDPGAAASGAIAVTSDGVIIRGDISGAGRLGPIVEVGETDQRRAFTALKSWIPGGRIDRMLWSWIDYSGVAPTIYSGVLVQAPPEEHDFVFPKPAGVTDLSRICLRIEGTQTLADGSHVNVGAGMACHFPDFGDVMKVPSWWEPVTVPVWFPDSNENAVMRDYIAAHVSVQSDQPRKSNLTHNTLVYFADWQSAKPMDVLIRALEHMRSKRYSLVVIVVVPGGTFDSRRREIEARLESIEKRFPVQLWLTEDNQCGWTRTFAVAKFPSSYLIDAEGEYVWKYEGDPGAGVLANALDKDLLPAPAPRFKALRLAIAPGERAPDLTFADERGQLSALHRLRGRQVLLNFWQSWSAPCLKELRRLQQLHARSGEHGPVIVAFHGGKDRQGIDEARRQCGITFPLVQDTGQRIGRIYGVRCWPTTISINADGLVEHAQFGFLPAHAGLSAAPGGKGFLRR